jgi:hypothetical protein
MTGGRRVAVTEPTYEEDKDEKEYSGATDTAGNGTRDNAWRRRAVTARASTVCIAVTVIARSGGCVTSSART